jgi:hypothetical protein
MTLTPHEFSIDAVLFSRPKVIITFAGQKFDDELEMKETGRHRPHQAATRRFRKANPQGHPELVRLPFPLSGR